MTQKPHLRDLYRAIVFLNRYNDIFPEIWVFEIKHTYSTYVVPLEHNILFEHFLQSIQM